MRRSKTFRSTVLLALLVLLTDGGPLAAHTFLQLPLVVDVLEGEDITDATIRRRVEGLNRIIGQCGNISLTLAKIQRDWPDPIHPRGGDALGEARRDERRQLANQGDRELAREAAGSKFFVVSRIPDGNGATLVGRRSSVINDEAGDDRTWAHELGHQMGLRHGDEDSQAADNLMKDPRPPASGTNLTEGQCARIIEQLIRRGPIIERTIEQEFDLPRDSWAVVVFDDEAEPALELAYLDIRSLALSFDVSAEARTLYAEIELEAPIVDGVEVTYSLLIDRDANGATGGDFAKAYGIDFVVRAEVSGRFPFETRAQLLTWPDGQVVAPVRARVLRRFEESTGQAPAVSTDALELTIPLDPLGTLADPMRVGAVSASGDQGDQLRPQPVPTSPPPRPDLTLVDRAAVPGQKVELIGHGFNPGTRAALEIDHRPIAGIEIDAHGGFETVFVTPELRPGDYFLDVVDTSGRVGLAVFRVLGRALLGPTFFCLYDQGSVEMDYGVIGGTPGATYTVTGGASGSVIFSEPLHDLTANHAGADADDSTLRCDQAGSGSVTISFRQGGRKLYSCSQCFRCTKAGAVPKRVECRSANGASIDRPDRRSRPD